MVQFFAPHEIFRCEGIFMCTYYSVTLTLYLSHFVTAWSGEPCFPHRDLVVTRLVLAAAAWARLG